MLTDGQLAEARAAALDAAAGSGIVAVYECAGLDIGGLDDWQQLRDTDHGVELIGYWGEAVTSPAQARALVDDTSARGLAGDLFVDGPSGRAPPGCTSRTPMPRTASAPAISTSTPSLRMRERVPRPA